jgi:tetratricopeptide (TPR) repeat protein
LKILTIRNLIFLSGLFLLLVTGKAQAQQNPWRVQIDEARANLSYFDKQGLEKSREFIKKDSSYYVGHLYEGAYKYFRAADKQGFQQALKPLLRAYRQIERDYIGKLKLRTSDIFRYMDVYRYHFDFGVLNYMIAECYENTDQPGKAVELCQHYKKYKIQKSSFNPYTKLSWIYHRNRIYNKEQYSFLGENLEANERMAMKFLDSAEVIFYRDLSLNATFFSPGQMEMDLLNIYHYKAMMYSYNMKIDSAEYYYSKLLERGPDAPFNNYAHLKVVEGDFAGAIENFTKATFQPREGKQTREQYYMLSMLDVYTGNSAESVTKLKEIIKSQGSSPGFGWHNIALARNYHYLGLTEKSKLTTQKAEGFEEMYIGTTWLPEQYKSCAAVMQYMNKSAEIARVKFENRGWWYNISDLFRISKLYIERFLMEFNLANVFSQSHEREQVTYRIFSSENLVTFDEVWFLIKDFSPEFFTKKFTYLEQTDKRPNLKRYYRYFLAKIQLENDNYKVAKDSFEIVLSDKSIDRMNEKLLLARTYEALASIAEKNDNETDAEKYKELLYESYPQLLPFSGLKFKMNLSVPVQLTDDQQKIIASLKESNIEWTEQFDSRYPTASVTFSRKKENEEVNFSITKSGGTVLQKGSFIADNIEEAGKLTALGLFGINKFDSEL